MVQERPVRIERRLSAILAADVSGYSRLMHEDEEATHAKLMALLASGVTPAIAEHGGRIVKNTGDGFLAEFPSAVEAVRAAMQFQARVRKLTADDPDDRRFAFRVGINIGDVIVEPHDIFGDGVNIAARLESIAAPGGICISSAVYDQVQGKLGDRFADLGEQNLKNIGRPVGVYSVILDKPSPATLSQRAYSSAPSPPPLSIVVLPLANLSGDPEQDYFVDGVTGSLTTDLSRISGSFVIGQHTAFTYKGKLVDARQIGRELNVRYALEGSVQRCDNRLRVNVQLIDAKTGNHLWADRFDKPIADLLDMQDEIVARIARTLDIQLIVAEARRATRTLNPGAMDLYFQGRHSFNKGLTPEYLTEARDYFELALAIDPKNVDAMSWAATVEAALGVLFLTDHPHDHLKVAETIVLKALCLAPDHAWAHLTLAVLLIHTNRVAQGVAECERALALDRNLADAHELMGIAKHYMGCAADTDSHVNEALRLSPRDIFAFRWMNTAGFAKLQIAADAEAAAWFARGIEANRNYPLLHFGNAAALALLGRLDEAQVAAKTGLALDPTFTIRRLKNIPLRGDAKFVAGAKRMVKGLHIAGVPDG
ncbi:adenylate/guanylate cyclase domain-containing protein [Bradyrhizobium sp. IC3069]|uniref:adenylate/guanylate cyclase domain-containing protein n=1 Tax=unclassified Bradyrhizobium TaxID=2631580 RepID=UPI001CD74C87|nr:MULTISPECIES: adenylate/guanylate cyclase domain-containing protein [unclassified Bradyrhizobium]MCA1364996.1 adenylate/guanylate cyclase domain-containing protein [Bradyrhizobium sp. IC4059]MCA1522661.1 adenylate/guanylate cyclase domain-containing protein [Bradyrhizobium sp. IC3069]